MTPQDVKQISIRLQPDGFSFLNQFHPILPGADFSKRLQEQLIETSSTSNEEAEIKACLVESCRFLLSPLDITSETAELMYHTSLPEAEQEEMLIELKDEAHGVRLTFGIESQLYYFILRNWPDIEISHPLYLLIEQWADQECIIDDCMVAEADEKSLNLLVFKNKKLYLANRFEDMGINNITYHLMNCWTQSQLDVLDNKLHLITDNKELRHNIEQYIKQCE